MASRIASRRASWALEVGFKEGFLASSCDQWRCFKEGFKACFLGFRLELQGRVQEGVQGDNGVDFSVNFLASSCD